MKSLVLAICAGLFVFLPSCRKDRYSNYTSIIGTWELRKTSGGWMTPTDHQRGNGNQLKFTATNYEQYENGTLVKSGAYSIVSDSTYEQNVCLNNPEKRFRQRIIFDNDTASAKKFIDLFSSKLSIASGCYALDAGQTKEYEKISQ